MLYHYLFSRFYILLIRTRRATNLFDPLFDTTKYNTKRFVFYAAASNGKKINKSTIYSSFYHALCIPQPFSSINAFNNTSIINGNYNNQIRASFRSHSGVTTDIRVPVFQASGVRNSYLMNRQALVVLQIFVVNRYYLFNTTFCSSQFIIRYICAQSTNKIKSRTFDESFLLTISHVYVQILIILMNENVHVRRVCNCKWYVHMRVCVFIFYVGRSLYN